MQVICLPKDIEFRVSLNETLELFSQVEQEDLPSHCKYGQVRDFITFLEKIVKLDIPCFCKMTVFITFLLT